MEYYGDENKGGVNGHFYHVFGTVRGFLLWNRLRVDLTRNG